MKLSPIKCHNTLEVCTEFLESDYSKRYIFGTGKYSQALASNISFHGFIETHPQSKQLNGKEVFKLSEIPKDSKIINGSCLWPFASSRILANSGFTSPHILFFAHMILRQHLYFPNFNVIYQGDLQVLKSLHGDLADKKSQNLLESIIKFRLTSNINYLYSHVSKKRQYFENFLNLPEKSIFFDVGAFDGADSQYFLEKFPRSIASYAFEPNPKQAEPLTKLGKLDSRIHLLPYALGEKSSWSKFDSAQTASRLQENGKDLVEVKRLDDLILPKPNFIKMDIEGGELNALKGSSKIISLSNPSLAISVYHQAEDLGSIYKFLKPNSSRGKYYLRQYTEGTDEIVLYYIPNSN